MRTLLARCWGNCPVDTSQPSKPESSRSNGLSVMHLSVDVQLLKASSVKAMLIYTCCVSITLYAFVLSLAISLSRALYVATIMHFPLDPLRRLGRASRL